MEIDFSQVRAIAVEDDLAGVALIGTMLRRLQIQAYVDPTGNDIVQMALRMRPHFILMDLNLPNRSGFDLMERIRSMPELRHIPIVALSAMSPQMAIPRCREMGFDGFLAKPLRSRHLARQLTRLLNGETVWDVGETGEIAGEVAART
ncbi:MAG: response regulator [Anaerolineae bacterium]|jgi:CheY-like chemotaxis protein|nr:response regulator [Anaerolineae bacterium]